MENSREMMLIGHYSFVSKDKSNTYYVLQCITRDDANVTKGILINIFTDVDTYNEVLKNYDIGSDISVVSSINYSTGKVYYSVKL